MNIEIKEKMAKQILTEVKGYLDSGFTHSLNPYSGCAFACSYCYVREMPLQRFRDLPWGNWIDIKINAAEIYLTEMSKLRRKGKPVRIYMSSATDPYQPLERQAGITRRLLEAMLELPPDLLVIQTRSPLVIHDIDLLLKLKEKCNLIISMTIETDREEIKRLFAPLAPGIKQRLKALRKLHEAGIMTQAAISPVLPFTPEFPKLLVGIVDRIWIDTLMIGDGLQGKRSARLGMPKLFKEHGLTEWYEHDIHLRVENYFKKTFPEEMIFLSKEEAFPM